MREICTPGSEWGDGYKVPCRLGEATDSKGQRRQGSAKATVLRPVSTSHQILAFGFILRILRQELIDGVISSIGVAIEHGFAIPIPEVISIAAIF